MFYVRPQRTEQCLTGPVSIPHSLSINELNEICLFNNLQRQYAYKQQQIEKRQIQKLNQPAIEYTQDIKNYYILLSKKVNKSNYQYMSKFNGYSLKQYDGNTLIVKSSKDNFYKNFTLPENIDLYKDITYKLVSNGYKMVISIPKQTPKYQLKTQTFGLPDMFNNLRLLCDSLNDEDKVYNCQSRERKNSEREGSKIRIPISGDIESENVAVSQKHSMDVDEEEAVEENTNKETEEDGEEDGEEEEKEEEGEDVNLRSLITDAEEEIVIESIDELKPVDALKNYNTIRRQTVFIPNTILSDSEETNSKVQEKASTSSKRKNTPLLEDLVDAEFL